MESRSGGRPGAPAQEVGDLGIDDLSEIASLHLLAFPDSALTHLGHEAVRRNYLWQFEGPHDLVALGVRSDGRLVGFLFGGVFRGSTIGFVKREHWFLLGRVLRNPSMIVNAKSLSRIGLALRLLGRRSKPTGSSSGPEEPVEAPVRSFGVASIAVDPSTQGSGFGQLLMAEAEARARAAGFSTMHLTVHPDNERAVRFYEQGGWTRARGADGAWSGRMTRPLDDA